MLRAFFVSGKPEAPCVQNGPTRRGPKSVDGFVDLAEPVFKPTSKCCMDTIQEWEPFTLYCSQPNLAESFHEMKFVYFDSRRAAFTAEMPLTKQ